MGNDWITRYPDLGSILEDLLKDVASSDGRQFQALTRRSFDLDRMKFMERGVVCGLSRSFPGLPGKVIYSDMTGLKKYLWLSQVSLVGLLLVCLLLMPSVLTSSGGASDFGDHANTLVPYILSFTLCMGFLLMGAARQIEADQGLRPRAGLLIVLCAFELLVLLSTFVRHINRTYSEIHDYLGVAMYVYEYAVSIWLVVRHGNFKTIPFLLVESIGSSIGLLSLLNAVHFLFIGQAVGAIGFGLLLVTIYPEVAERDHLPTRANTDHNLDQGGRQE